MQAFDQRKPLKVLMLSGYGLLGGDIQTNMVALRSFDPGKFDLYVISKPRGEVYEQLKQIPGLKVFPMEMGNSELSLPGQSKKIIRAMEFFAAALRITAFVKQHHIDVIYTIDRSVDPNLGALVTRLTGCPFVLNAAFPYYPQTGAMARFVLRQAARVQIHSRFLQERLQPYVKDHSRFKVIQHGLELDHYDLALDGSDIRKLYDVDATSPLIVMMGRLDPYKGQDDLIQAAAIVIRERPDAQFLIAGRAAWADGGAVKQSLDDLIVRLAVGKNVRLIGYAPSIPQFLAAATIVAMPSQEEPYGIVAMEAMAMARPVVSTRAGGVPEFVVHKQVGMLVPPRNPAELAKAILYLINNPEAAQAMGQEGRRRIEEYHTARGYARQVAELIEDAALSKAR
ncbi:MAG: glycosyltransferase family 4 protein [Roseiflexaceae bacterium]